MFDVSNVRLGGAASWVKFYMLDDQKVNDAMQLLFGFYSVL